MLFKVESFFFLNLFLQLTFVLFRYFTGTAYLTFGEVLNPDILVTIKKLSSVMHLTVILAVLFHICNAEGKQFVG